MSLVLGSSHRKKIVRRSYDEVKNECLKTGRLWEDPEFPAVNSSISTKELEDVMVWKRPAELVDAPKFIDDGATRFDICQGDLGDCWFLAAVANLTLKNDLLQKVVPIDQTFEKPGYIGAFCFNIWYYGRWEEVVVDDRLPTVDGKLCYLKSASETEFWTALLEKAYAKLVGAYSNLDGGFMSESMTDLTGGFTEEIEIDAAPKDFFQILYKAMERGSMIACGFLGNRRDSSGIVSSHAYSVTDIKTIQTKLGDVTVLRLRNPWGKEEWTGSFSDGSTDWQEVSEEDRKKLGLVVKEDGEFWMPYESFMKSFSFVEICHLNAEFIDATEELESNRHETSSKKRWHAAAIEGEWRRTFNAGGGPENKDTFSMNPQYLIKLTEFDEHDTDSQCTVLVGLMQKDGRKVQFKEPDFYPIGFEIFKLRGDEHDHDLLDKNFFSENSPVAKVEPRLYRREVYGRFKLSIGSYAIIPYTQRPGLDCEFLLRIYSEKKCTAEEIDEATEAITLKPLPDCSTLLAHEAAELIQLKALESFNTFCGHDGVVDGFELQTLMSDIVRGFSLETARSVIALKDKDLSGGLSLDEFVELYCEVEYWMAAFMLYDSDKSGQIEAMNCRTVLNKIGFGLSNNVYKLICLRYASRKGKISLGDFINCAIKLRTLLEKFKAALQSEEAAKSRLKKIKKKKHLPKKLPSAQFELNKFITTVIYS